MVGCSSCGRTDRKLNHSTYVSKSGQGYPGSFCSMLCYDDFCHESELFEAMPHRQQHPPKRDSADGFPEHDHVWEVLLVQDLPVGVTCKICDHTVQMAEAPAPIKPIPSRPQPFIDLEINQIVELRIRGKLVGAASIQRVDQTTDYNGYTLMNLELRTDRQRMAPTSNTINLGSAYDRQDERVYEMGSYKPVYKL